MLIYIHLLDRRTVCIGFRLLCPYPRIRGSLFTIIAIRYPNDAVSHLSIAGGCMDVYRRQK